MLIAELKRHYRTIGAASGEPVLILQGTTRMARWYNEPLAALLGQAHRR